MLSNKNTKRKNNRTKKNTKNTKKRNNVKKNIRKYTKLAGGSTTPPAYENGYDYFTTIAENYFSASGKTVNAIAISSDKKIYVVNTNNHCIKIFNSRKVEKPEAILGIKDKAGDSNTQFKNPYGIAVANNLIYVADTNNHRVQIFDDKSKKYIATLGKTGSGGSSNTQLMSPMGVTVANNRIYVADTGNQRVQIFDEVTRNYIATLGTTGSEGTSNTQFNIPFCVAVAKNRIYVADSENHRVQIFDEVTRHYIATLGTTGSKCEIDSDSNTQFRHPNCVAVSDADNRIYVADFNKSRIQVFDGYTLNYITTIGSHGKFNMEFRKPEGVAVSDNLIYVVDSGNKRVKVFKKTHMGMFID